MLGILRSAAGTWVAKALLSLLVLSFLAWGVTTRMAGGFLAGHHPVITAGSTTVSITEYRLAYDRQINMLQQQIGQRISREQATAYGIDNQVLAQLVSGAVLDEQARKLGLGFSKDRLAELLRHDGELAIISQAIFVERHLGAAGGYDRIVAREATHHPPGNAPGEETHN